MSEFKEIELYGVLMHYDYTKNNIYNQKRRVLNLAKRYNYITIKCNVFYFTKLENAKLFIKSARNRGYNKCELLLGSVKAKAIYGNRDMIKEMEKIIDEQGN